MLTCRPPLTSRFAHTTQQAHGRWMRECWWPFLSAISPDEHPEHLQYPEQGSPPPKGRPSPLGPAFPLEPRFSLTLRSFDSMPHHRDWRKVA